jgi:hypothetical protein
MSHTPWRLLSLRVARQLGEIQDLPGRGIPGWSQWPGTASGNDLDSLALRRDLPFRDTQALEEAIVRPELYERVALRRDVTEHSLKKGDVALLIDRVPHPSGAEPGVVLEVFNAVGESISVVAVKESEIEALRADEVLMVRSLVQVG